MEKEHYTQRQKFDYIFKNFSCVVEAFSSTYSTNTQNANAALLGLVGGMFISFRAFGKFDRTWRQYVKDSLVDTLGALPDDCREAIISSISKV